MGRHLSAWAGLVDWSKREFSTLAWRKNRTLYSTLVSEIMLQQTTVSTVSKHYHPFLKRFPNLEALATASEDEITIAWKGLGYYRRARNLQKAAQGIVEGHKGRFPRGIEKLKELPGIGDYTASALESIGRNNWSVAVDANLERVLARFWGIELPKGPKLQKAIRQEFANYLQSEGLQEVCTPREFNEALMDLGRNFCQARKASCVLCPMRAHCKAYKSGRPLAFPVVEMTKGQVDKHQLGVARIICRTKSNQLYCVKREKGQWLAGQYEVPTLILSSSDSKLKQYPQGIKNLEKRLAPYLKKTFKTHITKYSIDNHVYEVSPGLAKKLFKEHSLSTEIIKGEVASQNVSTATLKALKSVENL